MSRYIDADLLKQSIPNTKMDEFENCRYCRLLDEEQVKDLIDQQQTADVRENVNGEWIESMHRVCGEREYKCSNCNKVIWSGAIDRYHFCPNCGADMRGEA